MRTMAQTSQNDSHLFSKKNMTTLAGGLGLALSSTAQSAVIYTDITDLFSTDSGSGGLSFDLDVDGDGTNEFIIQHSSSTGLAGLTHFYGQRGDTKTLNTTKYYADAFSVGDTIGGGSLSYLNSSLNNYDGTGNFLGIGDAFVGLEFNIGCSSFETTAI